MSAAIPECPSAHNMEANVLSCTLYGCKQTFSDVQTLNSHVQSHRIPTQSLPGKLFHCSSLGCTSSFASMQQLMDHMRLHYKPNHYFLCESCRAKLRSYRALLKHFHTCSKVARSRPKGDELSMMSDLGPASQDVHMESEPAGPVGDVPVPSLDVTPDATQTSAPPTNNTFPLVDPASFPTQPDGSLESYHTYLAQMPASPGQQQRAFRTNASSPAAPTTPPGSNAVWKKNQDVPGPVVHRRNSPPSSHSINAGQSFSSRILWEHTRGRYRCLQCGHFTASRQEMNHHIEVQHKGHDFRAFPPAAQTKSSPEAEPSVYTQL